MGKKLISLMIEEKLYLDVKDYCYKNDIKIKDFISNALILKLKEKNKK